MTFRACNPYYLRISETNVLPLYVFLDEQHLEFMSDRLLQHVLADLRPLILPKLKAESNAPSGPGGTKKGTVDVHRGDTYQFCFFFRKAEPHTVLIKSRTFVAAPPVTAAPHAPLHPPSPVPRVSKRKGRPPKDTSRSGGTGRKKPRLKKSAKVSAGSNDESEMSTESDDDSDGSATSEPITNSPRRSRRPKQPITPGSHDESESHSAAGSSRQPTISEDNGVPDTTSVDMVIEPPPMMDFEFEEEELKPKPLLKLGYKSFRIHGHSLCVVVEPRLPRQVSSGAPLRHPSLKAPTLASPNTMSAEEGESIQPPRAPLFLPDSDSLEASSQLGAPMSLSDDPQVYDVDGEDQSDNEGMMLFSQVLTAAGDFRAEADDDDGMDGTVFFGDADEGRE